MDTHQATFVWSEFEILFDKGRSGQNVFAFNGLCAMNVDATRSDQRSAFDEEKADRDLAFAQRMEEVIALAGGPSKLAKKSQLSTSVINKYRNSESDPSRARALRIAEAAGVSPLWFIAGIGPKLLSEHDASQIEPATNVGHVSNSVVLTPDEHATIGIPRYDVRLSAGGGSFVERAELLDRIPFTPRFLRRKLGRGSPEGLVIVEATGDSMEPTISDGDLVMIDTTDPTPRDGLYALVFDDALMVKRLHRMLDGLEIASDNRELYRPVVLPKERLAEVQIVGRVRWLGRVV